MYPDNGENSVGASNELSRQYKRVIQECEEKMADKYVEENVRFRWHFIPNHFFGNTAVVNIYNNY